MTTETLDKLYLEWSQFTKARTRREDALFTALDHAVRVANAAATGGDLPSNAEDLLAHANRVRTKYLSDDF